MDETLAPGEDAERAAMRLAHAKAAAVARNEPRPVLAADTLVVCDGRILGKPASAADAADMLRLLSGRAHDVVTARMPGVGRRAAHRAWSGPPSSSRP